ncbi:MAG: hypothetical protein R3E01_36455 [Pirellulaceae bacterium]
MTQYRLLQPHTTIAHHSVWIQRHYLQSMRKRLIFHRKTTMHYKTIVLELIEQRPRWHEQLKSSNSLLSTINQLAITLRNRHLDLLDQAEATPLQMSPIQHSSEALEKAIAELLEHFPREQEAAASDTLDMDALIAFLKRHTPQA